MTLTGWFYSDAGRLLHVALRRCAEPDGLFPWWVDHAGTIHWRNDYTPRPA